LGEWLQLVGTLVVIHLGLALLAAAAAVTEKGRPEVPAIARQPVGDFAKSFVYFFALAPAFAGVVASVLSGRAMIVDGAGPLVVLSGLAVVVAAGDVIQLHRPRVLAWIWAASLIAPALATVAAIVLLPWTLGVALPVNQPSLAMASFFTDAFNRRTGKPLAFVIGDARLGGLIALGSANRPSLMIDGLRERSPWISDAALRESGALAVWPLRDALGAPPSVLRARYPHLTAEVPRGFERPIQGLLPLFRVGWAIMRPQQGGAAADRKR
jgi:hypothetical protein